MLNLDQQMYPNCPTVQRTITIGGLSKSELIAKLQHCAIHTNAYGAILLHDDRFIVSAHVYTLQTVELTVAHLGFPDGATMELIFQRAKQLGLQLCPLELAPYWRLLYLDQPEDTHQDVRRNQAPSNSVTVASEPLSEDDTFPKGFYLRRMNGELWLRAYCADHLHCWSAWDRLIFVKPSEDGAATAE
ncbi:helicase [Paenibacillus campi]|uniref:helicase n=1 Tax=Paenibacillus campi TaxID=3106031 RepID=UPI002B00288B|nr:helicase [Paenibacillus sp. SGZ-1009]